MKMHMITGMTDSRAAEIFNGTIGKLSEDGSFVIAPEFKKLSSLFESMDTTPMSGFQGAILGRREMKVATRGLRFAEFDIPDALTKDFVANVVCSFSNKASSLYEKVLGRAIAETDMMSILIENERRTMVNAASDIVRNSGLNVYHVPVKVAFTAYGKPGMSNEDLLSKALDVKVMEIAEGGAQRSSAPGFGEMLTQPAEAQAQTGAGDGLQGDVDTVYQCTGNGYAAILASSAENAKALANAVMMQTVAYEGAQIRAKGIPTEVLTQSSEPLYRESEWTEDDNDHGYGERYRGD